MRCASSAAGAEEGHPDLGTGEGFYEMGMGAYAFQTRHAIRPGACHLPEAQEP